MSLRLGDEAPNFTAETTEGKIDFHQWKDGGWAVLFSHPADFTPICTTELGRTAALKDEFAKRNAKIIAVSVDPLDKHKGWVPDISKAAGVDVNFPIIADDSKTVAEAYDMIHPSEGDSSTVRCVFIIDPKNKVRTILTYPKSVGRNFTEILRTVDALQVTDSAGVSTPVDWNVGDKVVISPALSAEEAKAKYGEVEEVLPYLRYASVPTS
ncbi:MAG: peroxiredoxin [Mycobacteriales bacterium]